MGRSSQPRTAPKGKGKGPSASDRRADRRRPPKKKVCIFCAEKMTWVDYKDVNMLRRFMSERAKIRARRVTGNCSQHQRDVATAIKTARELALLPYGQRQVTDRGRGGRRRDRDAPMEISLSAEPEASLPEPAMESSADPEGPGEQTDTEAGGAGEEEGSPAGGTEGAG